MKTNDIGYTLAGLGDLIKGIKHLRDPDKEKREKLKEDLLKNPQLRDALINQFQNDPQGLSTLIGQAPRFGKANKSQYESTLDIIRKGELSPAGKAAKATNEFASLSAGANNELLGKYFKGEKLSDEDLENVASILNRASPAGIQKGKVDLSNATKQGNLLDIQTTNAKQSGDFANQDQAAQVAERERLQGYRNQLAPLFASMNKGDNLYKLNKGGRLAPNDLVAIQGVPEYARQYSDDMNAYFRELEDQDRNKNTANTRIQIAATNLVERSHLAGKPISYDEAVRVIQNPRPIMESTDEATKPIRDAMMSIRDYNSKDPVRLANAQRLYLTETKPIRDQLTGVGNRPGRNATEEDVYAINQALQNAYAGLGFEIPTAQLDTLKKGEHWWNDDVIKVGLKGGDKDIVKSLGLPEIKNPIQPISDNDKAYIQQSVASAISSNVTEADLIKALSSSSAPDTVKAEILNQFKAKKKK